MLSSKTNITDPVHPKVDRSPIGALGWPVFWSIMRSTHGTSLPSSNNISQLSSNYIKLNIAQMGMVFRACCWESDSIRKGKSMCTWRSEDSITKPLTVRPEIKVFTLQEFILYSCVWNRSCTSQEMNACQVIGYSDYPE